MSFLPWFPFYAQDFITDEAVMVMTNRQVGCYLKLLCFQWQEGSIPDDPGMLAALCGEPPADFAEQWKGIEGCFEASSSLPSGRVVNPRLFDIRREREVAHDRQSAGGKKGGKRSKRKRLQQKKRDKPASSLPEASKTKIKKPPLSPPHGGKGRGLAAPEDQEEDPITTADVIAEWNDYAAKHNRKPVEQLTKANVDDYLKRLQAFPGFWQIVSLELSRLNSLTRGKQWLTFRWLIKSEDNFAKFADGEYADGSKVSDEVARRTSVDNEKRKIEADKERKRVEAETACDYPELTRVIVAKPLNGHQALLGKHGHVTGYNLQRIVIGLDEKAELVKGHFIQTATVEPSEIEKEGVGK